MAFITFLALMQVETRASQPTYFFPVALSLLILGALGWLIAAVLGFARARAFGPSTRWFALASVCLIVYHLQFLLIGMLGAIGATQSENDFGMMLSVGAFFNLFIVLGAVCAIMGFVRLTDPK